MFSAAKLQLFLHICKKKQKKRIFFFFFLALAVGFLLTYPLLTHYLLSVMLNG